jgi:hypothetical protein
MDRHSPKDLMPDRGPTMPMLTQRTRLFPSDSDGAMNDAARAWIRPNSTEQLLLPLTSSRRDVSIGSAAVTAVAGNAGMASSSAFPEGTAGMPFDMDIPLQFSAASIGIPGLSAIGKGDSISPTTLPALGSMDEGDAMDPAAIARDASLLMSSIDTNQLPCPRLCGAVFSPGVGGLAGTANCV